MAEPGQGDRTEKPTRQKLRQARREGEVARSREIAMAVGMVAGLYVFGRLLPGYLEDFHTLFQLAFLIPIGEANLTPALSSVVAQAGWLVIKMILPLLLIPAAVLAAALVPGGWLWSTRHWAVRFKRMSPAANLGQLFGARHTGTVFVAWAKAIVLSLVLWQLSADALGGYEALQRMPLGTALQSAAGRMFDGLLALLTVLIAFALLDVPMQAFLFMRRQRMSRQELKEEMKSTEGRPEVRRRVRELQQRLARRGVRQAVPQADVVVVNPTHYAVALKYDAGRAEAPFVLAKGVDETALYIREVAVEHGIEVLTLPPLARALYHTSQVQQQIPAVLYQAVSQVLHYVLQLQAFRAGRRVASPRIPAHLVVPPGLDRSQA